MYNFLLFFNFKTISVFSFHLECFQDNKELFKYSLSKHENVTSAEDCQERLCQQEDKCSAFMYKIDTKECFLKRPPKRFLGIVQLNDAKNAVFGPKFCPGIQEMNVVS